MPMRPSSAKVGSSLSGTTANWCRAVTATPSTATPMAKRSHTTVTGEASSRATLVAMKEAPHTRTARSPSTIAAARALSVILPPLKPASPEVFGLPAHRHQDPAVAARVVEENELLDRAGFQLAVLAELQRPLGLSVRLSGGVEPENVRLDLLGADHGVGHGRQHEEENGQQQDEQGQAGDVGDPAD